MYSTHRTYTQGQFENDIVNDNPDFVGSGDYDAKWKLQSDSPAKDTGYSISSGTWASPDDYDEESRPSGDGWDIGAYEFDSVPANAIQGVTIN